MTSGPHGGYFPWETHVFPLRMLHRDLWIPLPVVGSIFPISRQLGVTDTDMMSSKYREYIKSMRSIFKPGVPTLIAAGHEHSLQIHVDPLGIFHAVTDVHGNVVVPEDRVRAALEVGTGDPERMRAELDVALGRAWDEELEPFRYAGDGAPVRWLHRVG